MTDDTAREFRLRRAIGCAIRRARADAQLSIFELARRANVQAPTLRACEAGAVWPSVRLLYRIARALPCSIDHLLREVA